MLELREYTFTQLDDRSCLSSLEKLPSGCEHHYTQAASKKLFQAWPPPVLTIDLERLEELAKAQLNQRLAITGVQQKLSAGTSKDGKAAKITVMDAVEEFILKLPVAHFPGLCELEHCCMQLAAVLDIAVAANGLVALPDESLAFITRRFDRTKNGRRHVEDFAQILAKFATGNDKYRGSYEQIANQIKLHATLPMLQLPLFFERVVFSFLTGNADMHMKNFMLFTDDPQHIKLTPAFDLTPSALLIPASEDDEDLALNLCGKKKKLKRKHFLAFYDHFDVSTKVFDDFLSKVKKREHDLIEVIESAFISIKHKSELWTLMRERFARLQP